MSRIFTLLSQHSILESTAQYLSLYDSFQLARTCSSLYALIRKPDTLFDYWKRIALCDGRGLRARQDFRGPYTSLTLGRHRPDFDEELEVRVWNRRCDASNALPRLKCGVNICGECRFVPRVKWTPDEGSRQRPYYNHDFRSNTILCYYMPCDAKVQQELTIRLSEFCDCDQYTRWICLSCKVEENRLDHQYRKTRIRRYWEELDKTYWKDRDEFIKYSLDQLTLPGPDEHYAFWCPCGVKSPKEGNIRCAWCKRRHERSQWRLGDDVITLFNLDPCYPHSPIEDPQTGVDRYADLGYSGPIYRVEDRH